MISYQSLGRPLAAALLVFGVSGCGEAAGDREPALPVIERTAERPPSSAEASTGRAANVGSEPGTSEPSESAEEPQSAPTAPPEQAREYVEQNVKTVLELQQYRLRSTAAIEDVGGVRGVATMVDLNPAVHSWFVLTLEWPGRPAEVYHLENPQPSRHRVRLDPLYLHGLTLQTRYGDERCDLWALRERSALALARQSGQPYAELCRTRLYLRNPVAGRKTTLEWATDFLRDRVVGGETITVFVRDRFLKDTHLSTSEVVELDPRTPRRPRLPAAPPPPAIDAAYRDHAVSAEALGLVPEGADPSALRVGRWHAIRGVPSVYLSAVQPRLLDAGLLRGYGRMLNPLDDVESTALVYLVAFDLDEHELGFALGTDHPRLDWSERVPSSVRLAGLPGPDGVGDAAPLVRTGMVSPEASSRVVGTFTGGFKRSHGAFKYSPLALRDQGTHYGFIEHGVVLSKPRAGLATVIVYTDGSVAFKTWTAADDADLWRVRHARQNGLPLVEPDPATGSVRPGALVPNWAHGNWSGSQEKRLRTLRAGACLIESEAGRYLVYGYFSGATPSGMALVFLAYGCEYALLLDMNALEHTYLALYRVKGGQFLTQHLIDEMSVLDRADSGQELPRFVGFPDNRDFFYLLRRSSP